jgi:hypothetical protein
MDDLVAIRASKFNKQRISAATNWSKRSELTDEENCMYVGGGTAGGVLTYPIVRPYIEVLLPAL